MNCPICGAELEPRGSRVNETGVTNFCYCPNCDSDLQYDGKEAWNISIPVGCYLCLLERLEALEGGPGRRLTILEGGKQDEKPEGGKK